MDVALERKIEKFHFFKTHFKKSLTLTEVIGGLLVASSVVTSMMYKHENRVSDNSAPIVQANDIMAAYQKKINGIEFSSNPEKLKKDIWTQFKVPTHFVYINDNKAEIVFTDKKNNHITVLIGKKENIVEKIEKN